MRHEAILENDDEACSEPAASSENVAKGSSKGIGEQVVMAAFEDYTSLDIVAWQGVAGDEGSGVTLRAFSLKPPRMS